MEKETSNIFEVLSKEDREKLFDDMSSYQKKLFIELENNSEKASSYNLSDLIFDFDKDFVEKILELELKAYLNENKDNNNRFNGSKKVNNFYIGDRLIDFNRPRLRKEKDFDSVLIPKRSKFVNDISDYVITLYAKNNSVNDIKEILKKMFDLNISTCVISNLANSLKSEVLSWRNRRLERCYFTVNIDCTYISIRDNKNLVKHKVPIYLAIGTRLDGHKEVVGIYLGNEDENKNVIDELYNKDIGESSNFWLTVFGDLKDRGVEKILFIVSDGLIGIESAIKQEFEDARYQRCVVHMVRDITKYADSKERKEVAADFKKIYSSLTISEANEMYDEFITKYKRKKTLLKKVEKYYEYIKPLFGLPQNIRKYIYTNNIVESANSKIKRGFYGRGALPNVESAINIIFVNLNDLEVKWAKTKVSNWDKISNELYSVFREEIKDYFE